MPSTRKKSKLPSPTRKKKAPSHRAAPWYQALEGHIVKAVIGPQMEHILQQGVASRKDLHAKWQTLARCSVSPETFNRWLKSAGYDGIFNQVRMISTPGPSPSHQEPSARTFPITMPVEAPVPVGPPPTREFDGVPDNEKPGWKGESSRALPIEALQGVFPLPLVEKDPDTGKPMTPGIEQSWGRLT